MSGISKINDSLVIIPARAGSKGVKGKNIKKLNFKPLIEYTLEFAIKNFEIENIVVSTDSDEVIKISENLGIRVPSKRPKELCTDESSIHDTLKHIIRGDKTSTRYPKTILLQPTSPFRKDEDIHQMNKIFDLKFDALVSVVKSKSNPYFNLFELNKKDFLVKSKNGVFNRRQDCPQVYEFNGSIYIFKTSSLLKGYLNDFKKIKKYEMSQEYSLDIDTYFDWEIAEYIVKSKK